MKAVAVYVAKARLSEMLGEVERGEQFTITRRGQPVAYLFAAKPLALSADPDMPDAAQAKAQRVIAAFAALDRVCEGVALDISVRAAIADGRD